MLDIAVTNLPHCHAWLKHPHHSSESSSRFFVDIDTALRPLQLKMYERGTEIRLAGAHQEFAS